MVRQESRAAAVAVWRRSLLVVGLTMPPPGPPGSALAYACAPEAVKQGVIAGERVGTQSPSEPGLAAHHAVGGGFEPVGPMVQAAVSQAVAVSPSWLSGLPGAAVGDGVPARSIQAAVLPEEQRAAHRQWRFYRAVL